MSELRLPPVNEWTEQAPSGITYLVDPLDRSLVDPNSPPSYIRQDARLSEGLDFLRDYGKFFDVSLSLGKKDEFSLIPGWTEKCVEEHDSFGHAEDPSEPELDGYYKRVMSLADGSKAPFSYVPVSTNSPSKADVVLAKMDTQLREELARIENGMNTGGTPSLRARELAGHVGSAGLVHMNALDWYAVSKVGLAAKDHYGRGTPSFRNRWSSFILAEPSSEDLLRKLDLFDVRVSEEPYRRCEEDWTESEQLGIIPNTLAAGYF